MYDVDLLFIHFYTFVEIFWTHLSTQMIMIIIAETKTNLGRSFIVKNTEVKKKSFMVKTSLIKTKTTVY